MGLAVPTGGIRAGDVILCFPTLDHVDALLPAFTGPTGFTREGVVRSMPKPDGRRVDKTLYSLLPGE